MSVIERNIPIPRKQRKGRHPFRQMNVGDTVFVTTRSAKTCAQQLEVRDSRYRFHIVLVDGGWEITRKE